MIQLIWWMEKLFLQVLKLIWLVVELILQVKKNYFAGGPSVHKNEEIVEQKPPHFQKALDVSFPCFTLDTRECDI